MIKRRVSRLLYRHPYLYHLLRPVWSRAKWIAGRAAFRVLPDGRWRQLLPETTIRVDLGTVRGVGAPPTDADGNALKAFGPVPSLSAELESWLHAVVSAADYRASRQFLDAEERVNRRESFYGITEAGLLVQEVEGLRAPDEPRPIEVWIRGDGGIIVHRGILRLLYAAVRGAPCLAANVIWRAPQWQRLRRELAFAARHSGRIYQKVLHPDFDVLPAGQICSDRIEVVRPFLPRELKTVLDVGANFGQFSRWLEDEGYAVTAVEEDPAVLYYLGLIRDTMGYGFKVFPGDVRKFKPTEPIDILWAMSVLHFFTKTEPDHESLIALLRRLSPKVIFFEPPRGDEYTKQGRFRIYQPDEFAQLVRDSARLREIRQLGVSSNGRPIYLIR